METGAEGGGEAQEEEEEEEEQFELDPIRSDRRMDSAVLNLDPSFAYLPRLTAALAALNLQVWRVMSFFSLSSLAGSQVGEIGSQRSCQKRYRVF